MNFTDVELSILSQLAYKNLSEKDTLWSSLLAHKGYLESSLGADYVPHINSLIARVKDNGCFIAKAQSNTSSGFAAFAVVDPINNDVTVACRGTELGETLKDPITAGKDLYEDVSLASANQTMQQKDMDAFMADIQAGGYDKYSFTGHSLGGNLAMYGAITLKDKSKLGECKTFNAPGYNEEFIAEHKKEIKEITSKKDPKDKKQPRVVSYQNRHDGVSEALNVPGTKVVVESKKKTLDGVSGHLQDDFVIDGNGFKRAKPQKKIITILGTILKYGGFVADNPETVGSISRFDFSLKSTASSSAVMGSAGGHSIKLSPNELRGQASEMLSLGNEYERLFNSVVFELNSVNRNWSSNLANNFAGKITSAQGRFKHIPDMLSSGAAVATLSANSYEDTDSLLTKVISEDIYKQDIGNIVGVLHK